MPRRLTVLFVVAIAGAGALVGAVPSAAAPPAPPGLDHFLCYAAAPVAGAPSFKVPTGVTLKNQFSPQPFKPKFGAADMHCNPANKILANRKFLAKSPSWHLLCFEITGRQVPNSHVVSLSNQFGTAKMKTRGPTRFCLPSLKSLKTPPSFNPPGPSEVMPDHFTCYPVAYAGPRHFVPPTDVKVRDQFAAQPVPVKIGDPQALCVPTEKSIQGSVKGPVKNPAAHLLCFQVSPTPVITPIWDQNQFGTGELGIKNTLGLCLPTNKKLIR